MEPGTRLGPYEIAARIGAGGMGEVWRARDTRLGREVAIKVLPAEFAEDPERLKRFEREAKATAALSHPNILEVHDVGTFEGAPYLVEELLEGESLKERIGRDALAVPEAVGIAVQIARGLAAAHEKGIVHRDLKPGNVFLTKHGAVKILDFGLAKLVEGAPVGEAETLTHAPTGATGFGQVLGTVAYMAPEQARGMAVDPRADVFAFGVVLYEMVTGKQPFRSDTATDTIAAILKEEPAALPGNIPVSLVAVIERCLAKEPAQRYQRGNEVEAALEAVRSEGPAPLWPSLRRSVRRHPWLVAANVAAAIAVLALVLDVGGVRGRALGRGNGGRAIRMAVLPFANLSGDPGQDYLSDGLTQEMIAQLGRLHPETLSVIARTSVMRFKKGDTPIDQIGRELGVDYVLEGSARREGGRVRVSAELIRVEGQAQLWADTYERELAGALVLESEVAQKVAGALALKLLPAEQTQLASARTVNPEAHDAYLKGSEYWPRLTATDFDTAERYFDLALEKDPTFAPAHAGLAMVWACRQQLGFVPPSQAGPKAKAEARRALELDDTVALAHFALATVLTWTDWDFPAAAREWVRTIDLDPGDAVAHANYSHYLMHVGRPDEAMTQIAAALKADPLNVIPRIFYGVDLVYLRRYEEALAAFHEALRMQPGEPAALCGAWLTYARLGREREAVEAAKEYVAVTYQDLAAERACDEAYARGGYTGAMRRVAEALVARSRGSFVLPFDIACFNLEAGDKARALDWLERGYEVRDPSMTYLGWGYFDGLRSEPRFQELVRRMKLPATAPGDQLRPTGAAS